MSYVNDNLLAGETVIINSDVHWFTYVTPAFIAFLGIAFFAYTRSLEPMGFVLLFVALCSLIRSYIQIKTTELAVTDKRVIAKFGLISRSTSELNLSKMEGLAVEQSIAGRIFDFGTLIISGTGGDKVVIPLIDQPYVFRKRALEIADKMRG